MQRFNWLTSLIRTFLLLTALMFVNSKAHSNNLDQQRIKLSKDLVQRLDSVLRVKLSDEWIQIIEDAQVLNELREHIDFLNQKVKIKGPDGSTAWRDLTWAEGQNGLLGLSFPERDRRESLAGTLRLLSDQMGYPADSIQTLKGKVHPLEILGTVFGRKGRSQIAVCNEAIATLESNWAHLPPEKGLLLERLLYGQWPAFATSVTYLQEVITGVEVGYEMMADGKSIPVVRAHLAGLLSSALALKSNFDGPKGYSVKIQRFLKSVEPLDCKETLKRKRK